MATYVKVIISISNAKVDSPYTYKVPNFFLDKIEIGKRVIVPFGFGNKNIEGYIVNIVYATDLQVKKIKSIIDIPDKEPIFSIDMLKLGKYMRDKYYCNFIDCLNVMKPAGFRFKTEYVIESIKKIDEIKKSSISKKGIEVIEYLEKNNFLVAENELVENLGVSIKRTIKSLEVKGIVRRLQLNSVRDLTQRIKVAYLNYELFNFHEIRDRVLEKEDSKSKILKYLIENKRGIVLELVKMFAKSKSPIDTLEKYGLIKVIEEEILRNADYSIYKEGNVKKELTEEQKKACAFINKKINIKSIKPIVLHGVTGSGKTEIYIRTLKKIIEKGQEGILLIPEISLTPQTVSRISSVFGDKVGVTHSRLSQGERFDQWKKARDGKISIMIGARSAVFAPFKNLGVIIIDEEHETTYKSETTPKYSTIDIAEKRGEISKALVILGSATPSLETYYKQDQGLYDIIKLNNRINNSFPNVKIVDMCEELREGNKSIFSTLLKKEISKALKRKEQIILFVNKRGSSSFVSCRSCGYVCTCEDCSVSYTYHSYSNNLICHYCGKEIENPSKCPVCASKYIKYFGVGTQKIEEEAKRTFGCSVVRMDFDSTSGKHSHSEILEVFRRGRADILVGTQMIAKGLDFENVTVVGIIAADLSINSGDFKSAETTFQLLTQVSGRAGRGKKNGAVFIQTYNPKHCSIIKASENDYEGFYSQEIKLRKMMDYPPFSSIFVVLVTSNDEKGIVEFLYRLKNVLENNNIYNYEILNPAPAVISKIKKRYRWKIIIKGKEEEKLKNFVIHCTNLEKEKTNVSNLNINLNLNPATIP